MQDFIIQTKANIWYGSFPLLEKFGFLNAFSCRLHGASDLADGMLNLALHTGDAQDKVLQNRLAFAQAIGVQADRFTTCAQVHGSKVVRVAQEQVGCGAFSLQDTIAQADALITDLPDVPLLLFFADCVPVLLADKRTGAIGLAHAGWRGTVAEIAAKTISAMQQFFGTRTQDLLAAIGPSIGSCCYEVDDFVYNQARKYQSYFLAKGNGKYQMDLWGINKQQLLDCGVSEDNIAVAGVCTAHNAEIFCSYRAENGHTGRMGVCLCRAEKK